MTIRRAAPTDAEAIRAIWNPIIRATVITFTDQEKTEAEVATLIETRNNAGQGVWVAEENGVIGFATYGAFRAGPGYARTAEHTILLAPEARGRGVGRALMAEIETQARIGGLRSLIGGVSGSNPEGIAFHLAVGFADVGRVRDAGWKFGRYHDLVLMQKFL